MASPLFSNPVINSDRSRDSSKRRRRKKAPIRKNHLEDQIQNQARWKSRAQQQIYTSKLRQALARLNLRGGSSNCGGGDDAPRRGKEVHEAADRVLAFTAKGRSRWSRAILANRLKLKFRNRKRKRVATASRVPTGSSRSRKPRVSVFRLKGKTLPAVQRKARLLGRLVPGCRKQPFQVILEETIDYISAVQMQIRAMTDLGDRLTAFSSTSTTARPGQTML